MNDWFIYYDGNYYSDEEWFTGVYELDDVIAKVKDTLKYEMNGGHADIYDGNDNFIIDVEI